jgi:hypothetical protein
MKTLYITAVLLALAGCGTNKTEDGPAVDTLSADTLADAPMPLDSTTPKATDGDAKNVPPINDTVPPAP